MPTPRPDESRKDFVGRCIPDVLEEGTAEDQKQAIAICFNMWREDKDEAKALVMKITKVQELQNGRVRWQARANTGEFDLLQERFDQAFFDDVNQVVTGQVKIKLYKGRALAVSATSPKSLYDTQLASFAMDGYDIQAARGFIDLFGLPMTVRGLKHKPKV